jgi:DNA-binding NtrC family response regulator
MVAASRILVVDDEPVVGESCRRILADEGHRIDVALSGREGLTRAFAEHFDLVITDLKMPDLDGLLLARQVRDGRPKTAVVIITGYGSIPSAVEAVRLGVTEYLEKPFTPEELSEAVHKALAAAAPAPPQTIEADLVRNVLRRAAHEPEFGRRLLTEGSRVLSGLTLSPEARAAIVSGDLAWIESECGELSDDERAWIERRLEAETW